MTEPIMLTAKDIMTRKLVTVRPDTRISEAIHVLIAKNISGVPVVNEAGALVGILSEQDCLRVLARGQYNAEDFEKTLSVAAFMSEPEYTIAPELGIFSIAESFFSYNVRRLPVTQGGKLVGLVSRRDVLRGIEDMIRRHRFPPPTKHREPKLYPSATDTPPGVIANKLK